MKKHPSNNTKTFKKKYSFFENMVLRGTSNNKLSPHKRWRNSFRVKYPTIKTYVSVQFNIPGTGYTDGPILTLDEYLENIDLIKSDPDYCMSELMDKREVKKLLMSQYRDSQGINLYYTRKDV